MEIRRKGGRVVTNTLESVEKVSRKLTVKEIIEFSKIVEATGPLVAQASCMLIAAMRAGKHLFMHGRDMDAMYAALMIIDEKLVKEYAVYEVTSRAWLNEDGVRTNTYHRYMASLDRETPRIHVDTGFSGSVPRVMHRRGWKVEAIWLIGANHSAAHRQIPLPECREEAWMRPAFTRYKSYAGDSAEMVIKKQMPTSWKSEMRTKVAGWCEELPHELDGGYYSKTFEDYVLAQEGSPKFWLWVNHLVDLIRNEWESYCAYYEATMASWEAPEDNYRSEGSAGVDLIWEAFDPRRVDASEQPNDEWQHCSHPWAVLDAQTRKDWEQKVFPACSAFQAKGVVVQVARDDSKPKDVPETLTGISGKVYRCKMLRRYYNGSFREAELGRKMTPGEFRAWAAKRDNWLEDFKTKLEIRYGAVAYKGGWFYFQAD